MSKYKVGDMIQFNVGDIINPSYNYGEVLYYLIIEVSENQKKYNTVHLASNRERPIGFDSAHYAYQIVSRA